jgi:hypothetical protein
VPWSIACPDTRTGAWQGDGHMPVAIVPSYDAVGRIDGLESAG